jgi:hypothetical protein
MLIPEAEAKAFHAVYPVLLGYVAERLGGVNGIADHESLLGSPLSDWARVRDALLGNLDLISSFCDENPARLSPDSIAQVKAWRHVVHGRFIVERNLKRHTVFLDTEHPPTAYGVLGLTTEIVDMLRFGPPAMVEATLLPWKDAIVCDGLIRGYNIMMGSGMRRSFRDAYKAAKTRGLVTSLDPDRPAPAKKTRARPKTSAIERLLKRCPRTVDDFITAYGEPRMDMAGDAALAYSTWGVDGRPEFDIDYLMIYGNIIRDQALYVYAKDGAITHVSVVDQTAWVKQDRKPHAGRRLMS